MVSKYKEQFDRLAATEPKPYRLRGATLLVEVLPKEDLKSAGGIIIAKSDSQRAQADEYRRGVGIVLLQGDGYGDGTPMEISVGSVVIMPYNPMYLSEFPGLKGYTQNALALINEGDVLFTYNSYADFERAKEALNAAP